jgi:hypothetical protein
MIRSLLLGALAIIVGVSLGLFLSPPLADLSLPHRPAVYPERSEPLLPTLYGIATHYDAERHGQSAWYTREGIDFYGAAGPALRAEEQHRWRNRYRVLVTSETTGRAVLVWVVDFCECRGGDERPKNDRLIDLAPDVWHALGIPLHRGVTRVTVELLDTR